jgi:hypothetical protein
MPLPPGVSPIDAGRAMMWLWGKRNQHAASKRRVSGTSVYGVKLASRVVALILPWRVEEYPGGIRWLAGVCGVRERVPEPWLYGKSGQLPPKHAATLAAICRTRAEQFAALADELEARAVEKPRSSRGEAKARRERRLLRDV